MRIRNKDKQGARRIADNLKAGVKFGLRMACFFAAAVVLFFGACGGENTEDGSPEGENSAASSTANQNESEGSQVKFDFPADLDYAKFDHSTAQHHRLPCLVCHVREDNSAKVKFPGHVPCSSCHTDHFADQNHAICSVCHTAPSSGEMKAFPKLASFGAKFDHALHIGQANCADCHRPTGKGAMFTIPVRASAHAACFQCHEPDAQFDDKKIDSCSLCHESGGGRLKVAVSRAFNAFSHAKHSAAKGLRCSSCHTVLADAASGKQVSAPVLAMHFATGRRQSCATCHNGKRAFGADDFANCKRCHQGTSFRF